MLTKKEALALDILSQTLETEIGFEVNIDVSPFYAMQIFRKMRRENEQFHRLVIEVSRDRPNEALWIYPAREQEQE